MKVLALVGAAQSGPLNTPATFANSASVISTFGANNPLTEAACYHITVARQPVMIVRTGNSTAGSKDTIDKTAATGTISGVGTTLLAALPSDDADCWVKFVTGGAVGTAGVTYQLSYDGGRSYGPTLALGVALTILFPENNNVGLQLTTANTVIAGDIIKFRTNAPNFNSAELISALEALRLSAVAWELVGIVGPVDATIFDAVVTKMAQMPERCWVGHVAVPTAVQTEATYLSALQTAFGAKSTTYGGLIAGAAYVSSANNGRAYRRAPIAPVASLLASVTEEVDIAYTDLGALKGVSVRDINGNPAEHDESANPGLDDARFITLRTWDGSPQGTFVNNPRLFSATGSDFEFFQHRRVMILARNAIRLYFQKRLSKPIVVDATSGFILESEALEIEAGADAACRAVLLAKPKASGGGVNGKRSRFTQLSRTDNILATKTLTVQSSVIPLAYPKTINDSLGFRNPATQILKA
jgi:hypothetical protein